MRTSQAEAFGFPFPILGVAGFAVITAIGVVLLAGADLAHWFWSTALADYGAGRGLLVTALTIAATLARAGLLSRVKIVGRRLATISAVTLIASGAYLAWYWYGAVFRSMRSDGLTSSVGGWRDEVIVWLTRYDAGSLALLLELVAIAAAIVATGGRWRRSTGSADDSVTISASLSGRNRDWPAGEHADARDDRHHGSRT